MTFLVLCTFDLKNASSQSYQNVYADLAKLGLKKVHKSSSGGDVVIPTTAAMGEFTGESATSVRDWISDKVTAAIRARGLRSEVFFSVGGLDWAWGASTS